MAIYFRGISSSQYVYSQDVPPLGATDIVIVSWTNETSGASGRGTFESIFDLPNVLSSSNTIDALSIGDYATVTSESTSPFYCTYAALGFASWSQDIGVPTDFSDNLEAWWEADRGVSVSGNSVTSWIDQSLNGYILTSSGGESPIYISDSAGVARRSIRFNGSTTRMAGGNILNPENTNMTWFLFVSTAAGIGGTVHICGKRNTGGAGGTDAGYLLSSYGSVGNYRQFMIDTGAAFAAGGNTANFFGDGIGHVVTAQIDRADGTWRNFTEGLLSDSGTKAGVINYNISSSGDFVVGSAPYTAGPIEYFNGEISAIICYRELLTGSKRDRVEAYLTNKYRKDLGY